MDYMTIFGMTGVMTGAAAFSKRGGRRVRIGEDKRQAVISHRTRGGPPGTVRLARI